MSGPWEKFQKTESTPSSGPWSKFSVKPVEDEGVFDPKTNAAISGLLAEMKSKGDISGKDLARGSLESLPTAGMLIGGALGGGAGFLAPIPGGSAIGSVGGAGLGSAAGESLKQTGLKYLLGDEGPKTTEELYGKLGEAAKEGMFGEMLGQTIAKPLQKLGGKLSEYQDALAEKIKQNAPEIKAAAKRLGFEAPLGFLSENPTVQKLESSLSQSPRMTATPERQAYENVQKGIKSASEKIEGFKTGESDFELGSRLQKGLKSEIQAQREPVAGIYKDINKDLMQIKLQPKITNQNVGILKKDPLFKTKDGQQFLNGVIDDLKSLDNVADLKEYRTNLRRSLSQNASDLDRMRVDKVYNQITNLRDASIQALKETDPFVKASGKSGSQVIDELHNKLALADAAHAENISSLQKIKDIAGTKGPVRSQSEFIRNIENIPEEQLIQRAANTNIRTLNEVKTKHPQLFENARVAKVNDLISKSMDKTGLNTTRFVKNFDKLEPEVQKALFDENQLQLINDLRTIHKETPAMVGPSGTPQGLDYQNLLSSSGYLSDIAKGILLKRRGALGPVSGALKSPMVEPAIKGLIKKAQEE